MYSVCSSYRIGFHRDKAPFEDDPSPPLVAAIIPHSFPIEFNADCVICLILVLSMESRCH